ncbi:hypothetical protein HK100_008534, partial [Physocladia obscura]
MIGSFLEQSVSHIIGIPEKSVFRGTIRGNLWTEIEYLEKLRFVFNHLRRSEVVKMDDGLKRKIAGAVSVDLVELSAEDDSEYEDFLIDSDTLELRKKYVIYHMDCVEGLKLLTRCTAQIIICDCPYNIGKNFGNKSDKKSLQDYLAWCDVWLAECLRVLKPNGTLYIYGFSETLAYLRVKLTCNVRWLV